MFQIDLEFLKKKKKTELSRLITTPREFHASQLFEINSRTHTLYISAD